MSYSKIQEFQLALEILSARRQFVLEHGRRLSGETWELELDALTLAIKSLQKWYREYIEAQSPQFIESFIATHQFHLRLENRHSDV